MKQAIAGVAPAELDEVTMMVVWPSIAATWPGRVIGWFCGITSLFALAAIPFALALYFLRLLPSVCGLPIHGVTYRLTNRRIIEERNEVYFGAISNLFRYFIAAKTIGFGVILYVLLSALVFGWGAPTTLMGTIATIVCGLIVVAGIVPLVADIPGPNFRFGVEGRSVALDRFDDVRIEVQSGQSWFKAGDLIFTLAGVETFRLEGVSRPEAFRETCIKAQMGYVGVQKALAEAVHA